MTLNASGNLGLGVTPSAWRSGDRALQIGLGSFWSDSQLTANFSQNHYFSSTGRKYIANGRATDYEQYDGYHAWKTAPSGTAGDAITFTQAMTLTNAGYLGINSTSPISQLSVKGVGGATGVTLTLENGGGVAALNDPMGIIDFYSNDPSVLSNGVFGRISVNNEFNGAWNGTQSRVATYMSFSTSANATLSEKMRITSVGQVLINTTSSLYPNVKLAVKQTLGERTMDIWSAWAGDQSTTALSIIKYDNVNSSSQVFLRFVTNNGSTANGQINGNGASQAAFGSWSDRRLKENIENLPSQLSNIMALRPVEFDYKNGSGHQIGFIAQEMQEIYSDAVGEDSDGFLTITGWSKTEARLVKAIQEQQAQISAQAIEIENLKQLIN
jgi:hypothetical protein